MMDPFDLAWSLLKSDRRAGFRRKAAPPPPPPPPPPPKDNTISPWAEQRRKEEALINTEPSQLDDQQLKQMIMDNMNKFFQLKQAYPQMGLPDEFMDWMFQDPQRTGLWDEHISRQGAESQE